MFISSLSAQTTYYISSSGNDWNDGLTQETAWATPFKIYARNIATPFVAGDSILFKRGETFNGSFTTISLKGSAGNPVVIGAYGTGAKPIINGDCQEYTWTAIAGRPGYYKTATGMNNLQASSPITAFHQYISGAWSRTIGYASVVPTARGLNYAVGDTLRVLGGTDPTRLAKYLVASIGTGGSVLTTSTIYGQSGNGYRPLPNLATSTNGSGSGCLISISITSGSATANNRGSDPASFAHWFDEHLLEGMIGISTYKDTLFLHTYGSIALPTSRDSLRMYHVVNATDTASHYYTIRDLDFRYFSTGLQGRGHNFDLINIATKNTFGSGVVMSSCQYGTMDSCRIDSAGDSGIYLIQAHRSTAKNNTVIAVGDTIDGLISGGIDLCGIGILGNYAWGRAQDTIGYSVIEYNKFYDIYRGFVDYYYNLGDTVRYNEGHGAGAAGSPHGGNIVMTHNNFTFQPTGGNGPNFGQLGTGCNIDFTYNTLDSVRTGYCFWTSTNNGGTINLNHNIFKGVTSGTYGDYKVAPNVYSTNNEFWGTNGHWTRNAVTTTSLATVQGWGYEAGSTLNESQAATPTITISATSYPFGNVWVNDTSEIYRYTIQGTSLTEDILITVPTGFRVLDISTLIWTDHIHVTDPNTTHIVYIIFIPTSATNYSGNITHASNGATTKNLAVTGTGVNEYFILEKTSGDNQSQYANTVCNPFVVTIKRGMNPEANVYVTWNISSVPENADGQSLTTLSGYTDVNGQASTTLTLGDSVGTYIVTVTAAEATGSPNTFTTTVIAPITPSSEAVYFGRKP